MAISDDFGPIDDGTLDKWTQLIGSGRSITAEKLDTGDTAESGFNLFAYSAEASGSDENWAKVTIADFVSVDDYYGVILRCSDLTASFNAYIIVVEGSGNTVCSSFSAGAYVDDPFSSSGITWADGDVLGASITGTGSGIEFKVWKNPVGAAPTSWGTADFTQGIGAFTQINTGQYIGIAEWSAPGQVSIYDDFSGGALSGLSVDFIAATSDLFEPTLILDVTQVIDFISPASELYEPGVGIEGSLAVDFIPSVEALYEPSVHTSELANGWFNEKWFRSPFFGTGWFGGNSVVTAGFINSASQTFEPIVSPGAVTLSVDFIASTSTTYQPLLNITGDIAVPFISSTEALYQPSVTVVAAQTLSPVFIAATSALYPPIPALVTQTTTIIDGAGSLTISTNYQSSTLYCSPASGWFTID